MNSRLKDVLLRVLSAVVALPIYFAAIILDWGNSVTILLLALIISVVALHEFYLICENVGIMPFKVLGIAAAVGINVIMYFYAFGKNLGFMRSAGGMDVRFILALMTLLMTLVSILHLFDRPLKGGIASIGATFLGLALIVFPFSHTILLKSMKDGVYYILLMNITVMLNDVAAYFGGVLCGKHKVGFAVSPNKSWEGYCFGLLFSVLSMVILNQFCISVLNRQLLSMIEAVLAGIIISLSATIGDLIESAVKRDGNIKDSGSLVPGHGGAWDVFDAIIFSTPLFYYYLVLRGAFSGI